MPQSYNPTETTPYQAYVPPEVTPAAAPTAMVQQQPYQFTGAPISGVGAAAGILDNIFRGYMRGKEEFAAKKVMQIKAKGDNLRNSYNQDASLLYQMAQSGTDPNSAEYKQALSAVQGSWGALNDWIGQHVNGQDDGTKKKKSKGGQQQQQLSDPLADLKSTDPNTRAKALFQLQQRMGPPVLWQIKNLQTPEAQAAIKSRSLAAQNELSSQENLQRKNEAQKTYDTLAGRPEEQMTDAEKSQLQNAKAVLFPPRQSGTTRLYRGPGGEQDWFLPGEAPQGWNAVQTGATKLYKGPDNKQGWYAPGGQPEGWEPVTSGSGPKEGSFGAYLKEKFGEHPSATDYTKARREWAQAGHVAGGGGGSGAGSADKNYQRWVAYYREHEPGKSPAEIDALARRKVEGSGQLVAGEIASDASTNPHQFDSDVLSQAIDRLRQMPEYSGKDPKIDHLDDALANIVGLGDEGYVYHTKENLGGPDSHGKYSGDVSADQLKGLERDLQNRIREVLSRQTALPADQRKAASRRMAPLFGPAAASASGPSPSSPPAATAPRQAAASSPSPGGGHAPVSDPNKPRKRTVYQNGKPHGTVELTDAEAKQLADDPDFKSHGGTIK